METSSDNEDVPLALSTGHKYVLVVPHSRDMIDTRSPPNVIICLVSTEYRHLAI